MQPQKSENSDKINDDFGKSVLNARLPKLELPKFSGKVIEFQSFYDKFNALVHETNLPNVTKFTYLTSSLLGEAMQCVKGLSVTDESYLIARKILEERYLRKDRMIFLHIQKLLGMRTAGHTLSNLWSLYNDIQTEIRSLAALGVTHDKYGVILTPLVLSRLPDELRLEWSRDGEGKESDLEYLLSSLLKEIQRRERAQTFEKTRMSNDDDKSRTKYNCCHTHLTKCYQ